LIYQSREHLNKPFQGSTKTNLAQQHATQQQVLPSSQETHISLSTIKLSLAFLYIKTYILIIGDVANISFGSQIFMRDR